jgi:hypothetical protein
MSLILVVLVAGVAYFWLRGTKLSRLHWLERLDLPGTWRWQDHDGTLELAGELSHGTFRKLEEGSILSGEWQLVGHELRLELSAAATITYDLRYFDAGKIGLRGADEESRIYVKTPNNVVPLRRGSA